MLCARVFLFLPVSNGRFFFLCAPHVFCWTWWKAAPRAGPLDDELPAGGMVAFIPVRGEFFWGGGTSLTICSLDSSSCSPGLTPLIVYERTFFSCIRWRPARRRCASAGRSHRSHLVTGRPTPGCTRCTPPLLPVQRQGVGPQTMAGSSRRSRRTGWAKRGGQAASEERWRAAAAGDRRLCLPGRGARGGRAGRRRRGAVGEEGLLHGGGHGRHCDGGPCGGNCGWLVCDAVGGGEQRWATRRCMGNKYWGRRRLNGDKSVGGGGGEHRRICVACKACCADVHPVRTTHRCVRCSFRKLICHEQAGAIIGMAWDLATPPQLISEVAALVSMATLERGTWERPGVAVL